MNDDTTVSLTVPTEVSATDLADLLADQLGHDALINLITAIDERVGEWAFSRLLVKLGQRLADEIEADGITEDD